MHIQLDIDMSLLKSMVDSHRGLESFPDASHIPTSLSASPEVETQEFAEAEPETKRVGVKGKKTSLWRSGRFLFTWQLWIVLMMGTVVGVGTTAFVLLVRLPSVRDCNHIFEPLASASLRFYCSEMAARDQTEAGLLKAIELLDALPSDHPLRPTADRYIENWALDLIVVAQDQFNDGDLKAALQILSKIPTHRLPCTQESCPRDEIKSWREEWQKTWNQAEEIYDSAESALLDQDWDKAAAIATQLLALNNRYWSVTKYQELSEQIQEVRGTNNYLAKAKDLAEKGGVDNLVQAIQLAASISSNSKLYPIAEAQISKFSRQIMDLAQDSLDNQNLSQALSIVQKIPSIAGLEEEIKDFTQLAKIQAKTWTGQVVDLEAAIREARALQVDRPLYSTAQRQINDWQAEIEDLKHLDRAKQLAKGGQISDLMTAIAEVSLVPRSHPRSDEAQALSDDWTHQIEVLEDQPYLDRAKQLAEAGTVVAYQAAISEINQIQRGRALYSEAQAQRDSWENQLERIEDAPQLEEARSLANQGNLSAAIASAQRIQPGRALYGEAQDDIETWRLQIQAESNLRQARGLGVAQDDPDSLSAAIRAASQVPDQAPQRDQADSDIEYWSKRLLQIAQERADYDLLGAIEVANRIPPNTNAFWDAQSLIQTWKQQAGLQEQR